MDLHRHLRSLALLIFILATYFSTALARHNRIRHNRHRHKRQNSYHTGSFVEDGDGAPESGDWGPWSGPSECSRSCGGGVAFQTRTCSSMSQDGAETCTGGHRRYFSCNIQDCPDLESDYRAEQCAEYNRNLFEGRYFEWVPYTKAPNKCELNCMPRGERFYYRHKRKVIDGTKCDEEKLDICVDGKCLTVGCDKMLGSNAREDRCRECAGDGSSCNPVSGVLKDTDLQVGYNDILLIPAGATNIRIREVEASSNYLAIRNDSGHYYLNGNWRIDFSRSLRFAGTIFHYERKPHGFFAPDQIVSLGPTTEPIFVVLLYQGTNPGVEYDYSIPKGVSQQTDPDGYSWIFDNFGECSATCGGGVQSRRVTCIRRKDEEVVDNHLCDPARQPENNHSCNTDPCPASWSVDEWGPCSEPCGEGGFQMRQVFCEKVVANGLPSVAEDEECTELVGPKPSISQPCNEGLECPQWHNGPWKPCDHLCGDGQQKRQVRCFRKMSGKIEVLEDPSCAGEKPEDAKPCMLRPCEGVDWVLSDWSGCEDKCGLTQETRKAFCANLEGKVYPDEKCHKDRIPDLVRDCESQVLCEFQWFAAQWSKCSAVCGNGVRTRKVFCGAYDTDGETIKKVEDEKCDVEEKYEDTKNCSGKAECAGQWFSGPWSACSKDCGGGDMSRKVICMKDNETVGVNNCDSSTTPFSSEECNKHQCSGDQIMPVEPEKVVSEEEECEEEEDGTFITMETTLGLDESSVTASPLVTDEEASGETDSSSGMTEEFLPSTSVDELSSSSSISMDTQSSGLTDFSPSSDSSTASSSITLDLMLSDDTYETSDTDSSLTTTSEDLVTTTSSSDSSSVGSVTGSGETTISASSDLSSDSTQSSDVSESSTDSSGASGGSTSDIEESSSALPGSSTSDLGSTSDNVPMSSSTDSDVTTSSDDGMSSASSMSSDSSSPTDDTTTDMSSSSISTESTLSESSSSDLSSSGDTTSSFETTEVSGSDVTMTSSSESVTDVPLSTPEEEVDDGAGDPGEVDYKDIPTNKLSSDPVSTIAEDSSLASASTLESGVSSSTEETSSIGGESGGTTSTGESGGTTVSGESGGTTVSGESGGTSVSGESEGTTVSGESGGTTASSESGGTTVSGESTFTTVSGETEVSSVLGESGGTSVDDELMTGTSQSPIELAITKEQKVKKCKPKKKPDMKKCEKSTFGCCPDGAMEAEGPFSKGCPTPKTCNETMHGCCPDGVSPAEGPKDKGCPQSLCSETLFGCCQDGISAAEGNDFEGCKIDDGMVEFKCQSTEFGCCPDEMSAATGPNNAGCFECEGSGDCDSCEDTKYGCCPDGSSAAASGPDFAGCDDGEGSGQMFSTTQGPGDDDCADSTHGCCPDGHMAATGLNFEGCGVINHENCTISYFGCCPNGETPALGPNFDGCRMPCETETFGCCEDGITPAHGPNLEGCCLTSSYGCCPDNILAAQGPNLEGCGCQYARYGCCPDNSTVARGPSNEGCGCQHTPHGCCPNRYTPAAGPDFEGCLCYTYQFGCCPDGVTVAKGPHSQGCGCDRTEFGCCTDGRTQALGPDGAGCGCDSSKFGCCPDGTTEAEGDNFEGCTNLPSVPGEACTQSKDRGSCRDFSVKWFFDMEYGGCSRFWYGGCEGNKNRFSNPEECKNTCVEPPGKDACYLPKIEGPCEGYYPTWFYDTDRKQCGQFIYGGCLGNNNKFKTLEECEELCGTSETADACEQPKHEGPCEGNFTRWYYDAESRVCQQFKYGGCKANQNNFPSESSCVQQCLTPGRSRDLCALPRDVGTCNERLPKWFFDASENRCMPFYYTGCDGNTNRFDTEEACMADCPPKVEQDTCLLPALAGECQNYTERWYYDSFQVRCSRFYYGGCGGNHNNFPTMLACEQRCEGGVATQPPHVEEFREEFCFLPNEQGPCTELRAQWFYDSRDGVCKQFRYGGCDGNENRFDRKDDCEQKCSRVQDVCTLPVVVGPCSGSSRQWYYDRGTDTCNQFDYSGCQGNGNRFNDMRQCEERCKRSPAVIPPQPVVPPTQGPPQSQGSPSDICRTPVDPGRCNGNHAAWFYDERTRSCQAFIYGGCEGNANRFDSQEQCERQCGQFVGQDVCNTAHDSGPCDSNFRKWFFDAPSGTCQEFGYGGCEGNGNRFSSEEECASICVHREEPLPGGNDTSLSHRAVCRLPVDTGPCAGGDFKRWYFDDDRQTCIPFIYTGCAGNLNRFKNFKACLTFCNEALQEGETKELQPGNRPDEVTPNEVDVESPPLKPEPSCQSAREECIRLRCPYGSERRLDADNCERCQCYNPCRDYVCPDGTRCAVDLHRDPETGNTDPVGVCRRVSKPGVCPAIASGSSSCVSECYTDADCAADNKCCPHDCGSSCVVPSDTERPPTRPVEPVQPDGRVEPPRIVVTEPEVQAEEGSYATLRCIARGHPTPTVTWRKGSTTIDGSGGRHKLLLDGSLQIIGLYRTDAGNYVCSADNGVGQPAQREIRLDVSDPTSKPAEIIGEPNTYVVVTLRASASLQCYAIGWPRPTVTWWSGERMLPLSSEHYEQRRDYSLLIRSVTLRNLGPYTCQAYNGVGKAASWSITVQAIGPVFSSNPEDQSYLQYLIAQPKRPENATSMPPDRPSYPYRPVRPPPEPPVVPAQPPVPPVVPEEPRPQETPRSFIVPVSANITADTSTYPIGSDISILCSVDGYPIPRVVWFKDGQPLIPNERIQISESHRLLIVRANSSDMGTYRCEASNQYESSSSSISVAVQGVYIHPNCTDNPFFANCQLIVHAHYCTHKYYARFCCKSCTEAGQLPSFGPHLQRTGTTAQRGSSRNK